MRIAIIDDLPADRENLREAISRWCEKQGVPLMPPPALFSGGEEFLAAFSPGTYDCVFLDIYMDGMTGMETARRLREQDGSCRLIFTTATSEFAVDSYEVDAAFYLVKPFSDERLAQAMARCGAELLEENRFLEVPGRCGSQRIFLHRITYTEYQGRCVQIHFAGADTVSVPMRQADFAALLLPFPYFCDCNRGLLVNLEQVGRLLDNRFLLKGGTEVPISRLKYKEVREKFLSFSYAKVRGGQ